jgi:hypothetical protein
MQTVTTLTSRDRQRLADAHRRYREADASFEAAPEGTHEQEVAAGVALEAQTALVRLMVSLGVASMEEVSALID